MADDARTRLLRFLADARSCARALDDVAESACQVVNAWENRDLSWLRQAVSELEESLERHDLLAGATE